MTDTTYLDAVAVQNIFDGSPFISFLGLNVQELDIEGKCLVVDMPLRAEIERRAGTNMFHGGAVASLIDTVGDFAIGMLVGGGVPTVNFRTDYLKPSMGPSIRATAIVRRIGRSLSVVDIDVYNSDGGLSAVGRATYSVLRS